MEPTTEPSSNPTPDPTETATPQATEGEMVRGPVYLDGADLRVEESEPLKLALHLQGNLPTPCHQLKYQISVEDEQGKIRVEAWSEAPSDQECIQVLQAMDETIELRVVEEGSYTVWLNGEEVGSIDL